MNRKVRVIIASSLLIVFFFAAYVIWTMAKEEEHMINYRQKLNIINHEIENLEKKTPAQYYQEARLKLLREKAICLRYISEV